MEGLVYLNGRYCRPADAVINVFDHGLLYGDGIFEGIRAYHRRVFKLERHVERLFDSAKAIRLTIPHTPAEVCEIVLEACRRNEITDGYIRLVVTRGAGDLGVDPRKCQTPTIFAIVRPTVALYQSAATGVRVITASCRRVAPDTLSPSIKSLNYLNNVLARIEANDRGADEALLLDAAGYVAEATVDNVFIVVGEVLLTPATATNLKGITRETVIELAQRLGIRVVERPFTLFDLWTAREVFLCGTSAEVVPVISVDERQIGEGVGGPITMRILDAYHRLVRSEGHDIYDDESALESSATVVAG